MSRPQTWGGQTTEQRRAARRARFVVAGTEIWVEGGWTAVTMRAVCTRAGLIDRYFYESFADRDEILQAIWDRARDGVTAELAEVVGVADRGPIELLRDGIAVVVDGIVREPGRAMIVLGDHSGAAALRLRRRTLPVTITDVLVASGLRFLRDGIVPDEYRTAVFLGVGGFLEMIAAWQAGIIESGPDEIVAAVTRFGTVLGEHFLR